MAAISHDNNNIQLNGANKVTLAPINNHFEAIRNSAHPLLMLLMLLSNNKNKNAKSFSDKPSTPINKRNEGDVLLLIWKLTQENRDTDQARQESVIASVKEEQVTYDAQIKQWKKDQEAADKIKVTKRKAEKANFFDGVKDFFTGWKVNKKAPWASSNPAFSTTFTNTEFQGDCNGSTRRHTTVTDEGHLQEFNSKENTTIKLDQASSERTQQKMDMEMQTKFSTIQADETSDVNMSQEVLKLYTSTHNVQS